MTILREVEETLDSLLFNLHALPTRFAESRLGISHYDLSAIVTMAGIVSSNVYLMSTAAHTLLSSGNTYDIVLAGLVDAGYYFLFYKPDLERARQEKIRDEYLGKQGIDVHGFEVALQRRDQVSFAKWYLMSELTIPLLFTASVMFTSPIATAALMLSTACIYGARNVMLAK